jgi:hypothetical protein
LDAVVKAVGKDCFPRTIFVGYGGVRGICLTGFVLYEPGSRRCQRFACDAGVLILAILARMAVGVQRSI